MRHQATTDVSYRTGQRAQGIVAGSAYMLRGAVRIPVTTDTFTFGVEVQWTNAQGQVIATTPVKSYTTHTKGAWTAFSLNLRAPAGAKSATVSMVVTSLSGMVDIDELVLRP